MERHRDRRTGSPSNRSDGYDGWYCGYRNEPEWSGGIPAANMREVRMDDIITLGQNQMIGVDYVTVGGAAVVTIWGYFEKDDA